MLFPGIMGLAFAWGDRWGLYQSMDLASLAPGPALFICCTETCVGALVKNVNGAAPCLVCEREGSGSPKLVRVMGGDLARVF